MTKTSISRREFMKLGTLSLGALAFSPRRFKAYPKYEPEDAIGVVRVGAREMKIYSEPTYESDPVAVIPRDEIFNFYEKIISPYGPAFNPRWYRVDGGFAHTAYLQVVTTEMQTPTYDIPEGGQIGEISVPYTQTMRYSKYYGWEDLYRLYFQSVHWITGIDQGPDGITPYYQITDDLLKVDYWVPARHVRLIPAEEITPLASDVPPEEKRVEVRIKHQSLTAYEGEKIVLHTEISTGIPNVVATDNGIPTATPRGKFNVELKVPVRHMGDGKLTNDINAYELPGVPWVSFFEGTGVAFHGTYWHDNFGNEMSHGCVNMRMDEAKWLWRWVTPEIAPGDWKKVGKGTRVEVI